MKRKPRKIAVANQKGGVGKTTTACQLAHAMANQGKSVLIIDVDFQMNCTFALLGLGQKPEVNLLRVMQGEVKAKDSIFEVSDKIDLIPSNPDLKSTDLIFGQEVGRERLLKEAIKGLNYDVTIFDCPPSLGIMTINAFMAADEVIIPVSPSTWALTGLDALTEDIQTIRQRMGHNKLRVLGAVQTMADNTNVSRDIGVALQNRFKKDFFKTLIPRRISMEEANSRSEPIGNYDPNSEVVAAYSNLAEEVLARG